MSSNGECNVVINFDGIFLFVFEEKEAEIGVYSEAKIGVYSEAEDHAFSLGVEAEKSGYPKQAFRTPAISHRELRELAARCVSGKIQFQIESNGSPDTKNSVVIDKSFTDGVIRFGGEGSDFYPNNTLAPDKATAYAPWMVFDFGTFHSEQSEGDRVSNGSETVFKVPLDLYRLIDSKIITPESECWKKLVNDCNGLVKKLNNNQTFNSLVSVKHHISASESVSHLVIKYTELLPDEQGLVREHLRELLRVPLSSGWNYTISCRNCDINERPRRDGMQFHASAFRDQLTDKVVYELLTLSSGGSVGRTGCCVPIRIETLSPN